MSTIGPNRPIADKDSSARRTARRQTAADLERAIRAQGGAIHRSDLLDAGWSSRDVLAARRQLQLPLLRRRWLVAPDAPRRFLEAANVGGAVTCVSALDAFGLWVPPDIEHVPHIRVEPNATAEARDAVLHRARPAVARLDRSLIDPIENVLAAVATCLPMESAFAIWESAITTGKARLEYLRGVPWRSRRARELAMRISGRSDSGVESTFVWRCRRAGIRVVQQVVIAGQRVDALIGKRLVVQLDGVAFHKDAAQRRRDIRHDRALAALGYTVLRFDYFDVMHDWERVEQELRQAIARGLAD